MVVITFNLIGKQSVKSLLNDKFFMYLHIPLDSLGIILHEKSLKAIQKSDAQVFYGIYLSYQMRKSYIFTLKKSLKHLSYCEINT